MKSNNSVFLVYDDERGLHSDYEDWLEELAPRAPTSQYLHNEPAKLALSQVEGTTPTLT